jgi:hypothetical protein
LKKAIALLIALAAWASPIHAASAQTETKTEISLPSTIDSNYVAEVSEPTNVVSNQAATNDALQKNSSKREPPVGLSQPKRGGTYSGRDYSVSEVQALIIRYSQQYGTSPEIPLAIAKCESGFRYDAKNKSSSASGVFQWLSSSWRSQPASEGGTVSVFNADKNISAAVWLIAHGQTSPWNASRSCWSR